MKLAKHLLILMSALLAFSAQAQDENKIQKLFQDAIQAMGGDAFMQVEGIVSEGNYFQFDRDGNSGGLVKYNDFTKLPDKSRFEIGNRKKARDITVFNLQTKEGWILEGQRDTRDATPDEMKDFRDAVKHSFDNIFRFRWKDAANKLFYMGTGDGDEVQFECVKLLDPENDEISIYFDRLSKLPARIQYESIDKNGVRWRHREEYSQWHVIQGINSPLRMDSFRNGKKYSQQFVIKISYNNRLADAFFSKPVPPK
jgi:hypothetical protein